MGPKMGLGPFLSALATTEQKWRNGILKERKSESICFSFPIPICSLQKFLQEIEMGQKGP